MNTTIIKLGSKVVVICDGSKFERDDISDEEFELLQKAQKPEDIHKIMIPQHKELYKQKEMIEAIMTGISKSRILTLVGDSMYWKEIAELSMPIRLVEAVLKAEEAGDTKKLTAYKNFWTLSCLNPDERCRKNLFWFLERHDLKISKHGFFVAYRNADHTGKKGVYTDHHTHTFKIKIGEIVTLPREECDCSQDTECSRGLHLGGSNWLEKNYYGDQGLICLCNPADVVSVPHRSQYGKLRTCAYLPIAKAEFDDAGRVIPFDEETGFDCTYVAKVIYEGIMGTKEDSPYKIEIPQIPSIKATSITNQLLEIALKSITERQV